MCNKRTLIIIIVAIMLPITLIYNVMASANISINTESTGIIDNTEFTEVTLDSYYDAINDLSFWIYMAEGYLAPGNNYIVETAIKLQNEINYAKEIVESGTASYDDISAEIKSLQDAIDGLIVPTLDTSELFSVIEKGKEVTENGDFTEESYEAYSIAYTYAMIAYHYGQTQDEVDQAKFNLEEAINNLVRVESTLLTEVKETTCIVDFTELSNPGTIMTTVPEGTTEADILTDVIESETYMSISTTINHEFIEPSESTMSDISYTNFDPAESSTIVETSMSKVIETTKPEVNALLGDVNEDGRINIKDATLIQKSVARILFLSDFETSLADVDNNGKVNIRDATVIQKCIAKMDF